MSKLRALGRGLGTFLVVVGIGIVVIAVSLTIIGSSIEGRLTWNDAGTFVGMLVAGFVAAGIGAGIRSALK